jgi:hypothetical protein
MSYIGALIIFLLIVVIAVWFTHYQYKTGKLPDGVFKETYESFVHEADHLKDKYLATPEELYNKTVGYEFDDAAQLALEKAEKLDEKGIKKSGDAVGNSFILANLYNYNVAPGQKGKKKRTARRHAAKHFNKALHRLTVDTAEVVETAPQPAEFVIDRAEDFYDDYMIQLQAEDPILVQQIYIPNFNQIRDTVRQTRSSIAKEKVRKKKITNSKLPAKVAEQILYFEGRDIPNDPQNVHDSQVAEDMRQIYQRIATKNRTNNVQGEKHGEEVVTEIQAAINKFPFTGHRRDDALRTAKRMSGDDIKMSLGGSEREILINTWLRINDPENKKNRGSLKEAFMDSLASGIENKAEVCTMGRCSRVIGSLATLDKDPVIARPAKTAEILRNEVFMKSHKIIERTLLEYPKHVADAYQDPKSVNDTNRKQISELEVALRTNIEKEIRGDYQHVKPNVLDNLIKDAQAGV